MQRNAIEARAGWRARAAELGFTFAETDGLPYWTDDAYYSFDLKQIESDIEAPTEELAGLCYEAVERILGHEELLTRLGVPDFAWDYLLATWRNQNRDLYGRFDLRYDGRGPAKLYEFNADTPTGLYETAVFQWHWLEDQRAAGRLPEGADQFNSAHDRLIEGFRAIGQGAPLFHFTCVRDHAEDRGTVAYLEDCARQAGLRTEFLFIDEIGLTRDGAFVDARERALTHLFKLYPWEWLLREEFGRALCQSTIAIVEPAWKILLSNKGLLAVLWSLFEGHPNLLPAYFEDDPRVAELGGAYARKPLFGREGANIQLVGGTEPAGDSSGPYGAEGFIRQALAPLPDFAGARPVIGSWWIAGGAAGIGIREERGPVTSNTARFVPHAIL